MTVITHQTAHRAHVRFSITAMADLRSDLIRSFGIRATRDLLLRFGRRNGELAADTAVAATTAKSGQRRFYRELLSRELRKLGLSLRFEHKRTRSSPSELLDGVLLVGWTDSSQEALSHLSRQGRTDEPICWLTCGFISGFLTRIAGETLQCRETSCRASGADTCRFEVRAAADWQTQRDGSGNELPIADCNACGNERALCALDDVLKNITDPVVRRQLEACMVEVERFGTQLQLESERRQVEFRKRDDFLANILRDSADGIVTIDLDDCITSWNKGAESIYGYSEQETLGKNIEMLLPQESRDSGELASIRRTLDHEGVVRNFRTRRLTKFGRIIDVIVTRTSIRDESGKVIGSSAIVKDVTQIKNIENQLSRAEHLATLGELAASLAHEIKNPLAGIKGAIEVILDQCEGPTSHREILVEVTQEVKRIDRTIQDLLGYARPRDPHRTDIRIREAFRRVAILFDRTIAQKNIHLRINVDPDAEIVYADENLMDQVLLNLVLNGLQALEDNGTLVLATRRTYDADGIEVVVRDDGPGILPEILPRVFQPFFTTKKEGTGLGLATCKRIINDHGGSLTVSSVPGSGATFRIWLPNRALQDEYRSRDTSNGLEAGKAGNQPNLFN